MAAGLGFKDFTTGEVLTAADVDGYLMQGVWVFASAAARDAAVTSPQEGNFAYLKDTNVTTYYTGSAWANLDTTGMTNPMTTTGDTIYSSSGSTPARLGIGSTGQVLTVAGGVPSWATPAGGLTFVGACAYATTAQTNIPQNTATALNWNNEDYDTNGFHDNSTNNSRMTIPSGKGGYYAVMAQMGWNDGNSDVQLAMYVYKNGSIWNSYYANFGAYPVMIVNAILPASVSDYIEIYIKHYNPSNKSTDPLQVSAKFAIAYLGA